MKKFLALLAAVFAALAAFAQTPEEILSRMEEEINKHSESGQTMTFDIKMPIIGTMSTKTKVLGDRMRLDVTAMGETAIIWADGTTQWTYNPKSNEITIERDNGSASDEAGDLDIVEGVAEGYDVSIEKETDSAWYLLCKKSKNNQEKDDPKVIHLSVSKSTWLPLRISTKMNGVSVALYGISFGVRQKDVTFDRAAYPGAKLIDKR